RGLVHASRRALGIALDSLRQMPFQSIVLPGADRNRGVGVSIAAGWIVEASVARKRADFDRQENLSSAERERNTRRVSDHDAVLPCINSRQRMLGRKLGTALYHLVNSAAGPIENIPAAHPFQRIVGRQYPLIPELQIPARVRIGKTRARMPAQHSFRHFFSGGTLD